MEINNSKIILGKIDDVFEVSLELKDLAHVLFVGINSEVRENFVFRFLQQVQDIHEDIEIVSLDENSTDILELLEKYNSHEISNSIYTHRKRRKRFDILNQDPNSDDYIIPSYIEAPRKDDEYFRIIYVKNLDLIFEKFNNKQNVELLEKIREVISFGRHFGVLAMTSISKANSSDNILMLRANFPTFICFKCETEEESKKLIFKIGLESISDNQFYIRTSQTKVPLLINF